MLRKYIKIAKVSKDDKTREKDYVFVDDDGKAYHIFSGRNPP